MEQRRGEEKDTRKEKERDREIDSEGEKEKEGERVLRVPRCAPMCVSDNVTLCVCGHQLPDGSKAEK